MIKKYLSGIGTSYLNSNGVELTGGDDCAVLAAKAKLLISTDTSVAGIHFLKSMQPHAIAYRAVSTALSDIAAMGGVPTAFNLSLVIPTFDPAWMKDFRKGLIKISKEHKIPLIGGDLVKGPLQISVTVLGQPGRNILLRSGAKHGDILCLSGILGQAYMGLKEYKSSPFINAKTKPYLFPKAQVSYAQAIAPYATAAIDVSDGIFQDLSHLIDQSNIGCELDVEQVPVADRLYQKQCLEFGDDYQLLFTVPPNKLALLQSKIKSMGKKCHTIGVMKGPRLKILNNPFKTIKNWDHFR